MTPERTLLLVGLVGGLLFLAVTPPFQAPDEPHHFARAYQLSEGVLFPSAGRANLPASVLRAGTMFDALCFHTEERVDRDVLREAFALPLDPEQRVDGNIGGAALSTPAPYLPQALAALAGRGLGLRPLFLLYLCRLANLLASLAVAWTAVRIAPFLRWLFAFLALDPMALFLRSTASPDALIDAAALLLVAVCLALAARPVERPTEHPRAGLIALLLATVALLVLAKGASYLLLPGLVLLIPLARANSRQRALPLVALLPTVAAVSLAGAGLSGWAARRAYIPLRPEIGADLALQTAEILHHPLRFLGLAAVDAVRHAPVYAIQFVGNLGWLDTPLPPRSSWLRSPPPRPRPRRRRRRPHPRSSRPSPGRHDHRRYLLSHRRLPVPAVDPGGSELHRRHPRALPAPPGARRRPPLPEPALGARPRSLRRRARRHGRSRHGGVARPVGIAILRGMTVNTEGRLAGGPRRFERWL